MFRKTNCKTATTLVEEFVLGLEVGTTFNYGDLLKCIANQGVTVSQHTLAMIVTDLVDRQLCYRKTRKTLVAGPAPVIDEQLDGDELDNDPLYGLETRLAILECTMNENNMRLADIQQKLEHKQVADTVLLGHVLLLKKQLGAILQSLDIQVG